MIERRLSETLKQRIREYPAVILLGPRQVGKTTLALSVSEGIRSIYLDLESEPDLARLESAELYLREHFDELVILDEVHRRPGLLPVMRGLIDQARRDGHRYGLYLLLGSASPELLRQSGESLAGRVSYLELRPLDILEVAPDTNVVPRLLLRGGFPESFLADSNRRSLSWRRDFIRTFLERDVPAFGSRVAADRLRRLWTMLAHLQGSVLNVAQLARNLGVDSKTANAYLDLLTDLLLVRRLQPWHANVGKRLVRSPKVYIRDSGLTHALLDITSPDALLSHPVIGGSWEGFVVEQLLSVAPEGTSGYYYRTSGGAEIDLLLMLPGGELWAIEIKRSIRPKLDRGFHSAAQDLKPARSFVVYPGAESYPVTDSVRATSLHDLAKLLASS